MIDLFERQRRNLEKLHSFSNEFTERAIPRRELTCEEQKHLARLQRTASTILRRAVTPRSPAILERSGKIVRLQRL